MFKVAFNVEHCVEIVKSLRRQALHEGPGVYILTFFIFGVYVLISMH